MVFGSLIKFDDFNTFPRTENEDGIDFVVSREDSEKNRCLIHVTGLFNPLYVDC